MASLTEIVRYSDDYLSLAEVEDFLNALNGLQIENSGKVTKIGAAVDVSTATLKAAAERKIDFLLVHHGMFWSGLRPLTGSLHRQVKFAIENEIALYGAHLPLDFASRCWQQRAHHSVFRLRSIRTVSRAERRAIGRR